LYASEFLRSYRGILILLMQKHLEFQIVTPRALADFRGRTLILPDIRTMNDGEKSWLKEFAGKGNRVLITGTDATDLGDALNVVKMANCPGKAYETAMEKDFEHASPDSQREFFASLQGGESVKIQASAHIATSIARNPSGRVNVYLANFDGLRGGTNPIQTPQNGVTVTVKSSGELKGYVLPFLGEVQSVKGIRSGDSATFTLPTITRGAVFWYEQN
jgi:hypothetical protein